MEKGEFKGAIESVTARANDKVTGLLNLEIYNADVESVIVKLLKKVAEQAERGKKWASVVGKANEDSISQTEALFYAMVCASQFMQMEGFQTDEAQTVLGGLRHHQLTVFWADGKDIYEHELCQLGSVDTAHIRDAIII